MLGILKRLKEEKDFQEENLRQEKIRQEKLEEQKKKEEQKRELETLRQLDVKARQKLQGEFKERYFLAKSMGLEKQAEIARIEGMTNTQFIDLKEQDWILFKRIKSKLGVALGENSWSPSLETKHSSIQEFPGRITLGVMTRYQEVKDFFDEIRIMHHDIGSDPLMYGVKRWERGELGENLHFLIMMWE